MATDTPSGAQSGARSETATQARAVLDEAKETARSTLNERQRSAASGIGEFAGALRNAAQQIDGNENPTTARIAQQAADALERMSSSLRSKDLDSMLRDTERFARSQPALFLGAAVAAGFLAVRFLKSSNTRQQSDISDMQGEFNATDFGP